MPKPYKMNFSNNKLLYQLALTQINGVGDIIARQLLNTFGTPENIFKANRKDIQKVVGIANKLADEILNPDVFRKAEKELFFVEKNKIKVLFFNEEQYPNRLRECSDAPILLYYKGNADLNADKIISVVGTRKSSNWGNLFCDSFIKGLSDTIPDTLIISGLAYGIDVNAHKAALKNNMPTVGVLAHGLDRIYPQVHRQVAIEMLDNGGLLSDFPSKTEPDKFNFVRRNRIVAGIADATIVVESDIKGGSLITAEIANSYCKDVFAVPGRINDKYSAGCNKLIANHKADLFLSTEYFLQQMGWDKTTERKNKAPLQCELFVELNAEEQKIVNILKDCNEALHIDFIATNTGIPTYQLYAILLQLEMKNLVKNLPGNTFSIY